MVKIKPATIEKIKSYEELSDYVKHHQYYTEINCWAKHELVALFYEFVIACKAYLRLGKFPRGNHKEITNSLRKINSNLGAIYYSLYAVSKILRYENNPLNRTMRKDFLDDYLRGMNEIAKLIEKAAGVKIQ